MEGTYATGDSPVVPPHPIMIIAKVEAEMTKLVIVSVPYIANFRLGGVGKTHPMNPSAVGLANRLL